MKLNYKRTIYVGFAFFLICAFWQAYDSIVPMMLVNKFGLSQTVSGIIMSLDNVLAIFLLPLFGSLSDKTKTKFGRRTPYIVIGTVFAVVSFFGLTLADNIQLSRLNDFTNGGYERLFEENYEIKNAEYNAITDRGLPKKYTIADYASMIVKNKSYGELSDVEKAEVKEWYAEINAEYNLDHTKPETVYGFNSDTKTYEVLLGVKENGKITYKTLDGNEVGSHISQNNAYKNLVTPAIGNFALQKTIENPSTIIVFSFLLLLTLVAMAVFRSPAVALMPDITPKPLRSQANAVINLMGTAGGMLVLVAGMIFGTGKSYNQLMSYTPFIGAICLIMVFALIIFLTKVKEEKWVRENEIIQAENDEESAKNEQAVKECKKLTKEELKSLILILCSVALWYMGYNAVNSKYSLYAMNVLHKDYNSTLLTAQIAAIISYIPVGMLAQKIGRKKSILIGVALLASAFIGVIFVNENSPMSVLNPLFVLAGMGWATINVNSFPMVVELAKGGDSGKYTGFYYTASMAAQIATPILSGAIMELFGSMKPLFYYSSLMVCLSFITMLFVKHGDGKPIKKDNVLENLDIED